ncbi:MAG TPA: hypothetical protein VKI18_11235 [Albitalea sp.]|nr:hypothetical protein [Albitalea sp.]
MSALLFKRAAAAAGLVLALAMSSIQANSGEAVRAEVGRPLLLAQELLKAQKFAEALARIAEAEAVTNKTPYERFTIDRMRGTAAASAGDWSLALRSFDAVIASGLLSAPEQLKMLQAMAAAAYRAKDYARSAALAERYTKEGGSDHATRQLLIQSLYLNQAYAEAARELKASLRDDEKAGRTPTEEQLQLLANCHARQNDAAGYLDVLEKLVTHHPKKDYWADLLRRLPQRPGFASRLAFDVYRLQLATGTLTSMADHLEMAQLALQESSPVEARKVIERGFTSGVLGSGPDAERHKRLRELATKSVAEEQRSLVNSEAEASAAASAATGMPLFNLGWALLQQGQADKGIALMELGLQKGGLKRSEEARLHLGLALISTGHKAKAVPVLKAVQGNDGSADLARLWLALAAKNNE